MFDALFSQTGFLSDQLAKNLSETLSQQHLFMVVMDNHGQLWTSDSEKFSCFGSCQSRLKEICANLDHEKLPVVSQIEDYSTVAVRLVDEDEQINCGYLFLFLPHYSPESTLANMDIVETMLKQVLLIAKLVHEKNQLHQLHLKLLSGQIQTFETNLN